MQSLHELLEEKKIERGERKKKGGPRCEREMLLEETASLLSLSIPRIAGMTKGWSIHKMRDRLKLVKREGKNPAALWWWHYKNDKKGK